MIEKMLALPKEPTPPWTRFDTIAISALLIVAIVAHFWRLGVPNVLVYDEHVYVDEAYKYLRGEPFMEVHPPLAILLIALSAKLFGCHSWSWRMPSAAFGTMLIGITYLLARRMFYSRGAAVLGGLLMLCEGLFLEYSRLALINIAYLTLGAAAYLAMFGYLQSRDAGGRRRLLALMGVLLGLCLGSKFAIPGVTWTLVVGFVIVSSIVASFAPDEHLTSKELSYIFGIIALIGGISGFFFFLTFLPNYLVGWWTGISSLTSYYHRVFVANSYYPAPTSHQDSVWWGWPLLLRPYKYWQQQDDMGMYLAIWGGGNPAIWWAALVAFVLAAVRAIRGGGLRWSFLALGYLMYVAMWIPIHRALYLYSYMPALYLGILTMAGLLDECWRGAAEAWEQFAIMLPVFAVALLGLGRLYGTIASSLTMVGYIALLGRDRWPGRFVCAVFMATSIAVFFYFLPIWIPWPMARDAIDARMWFNDAGLGNWK